jgi:hypothetical protein
MSSGRRRRRDRRWCSKSEVEEFKDSRSRGSEVEESFFTQRISTAASERLGLYFLSLVLVVIVMPSSEFKKSSKQRRNGVIGSP